MSKDPIQHNALPAVFTDIARHRVKVTLNADDGMSDVESHSNNYYLIIVRAQVSMLSEFLAAYGSSHSRLAKSILSDEPSWCEYGVLLDESFNMVFAFNMEFASYNRATCLIEYKDAQDALADAMAQKADNDGTEGKDNEESVKPPRPPQLFQPGSSGWDMVVRYALPDPNEYPADGGSE